MLLMASACLSYCIECILGRYGFNCDKTCDGCLSDACDKENGTCNNTSGCKPGWRHGHPKCYQGILHKYCTFVFININENVDIKFSARDAFLE